MKREINYSNWREDLREVVDVPPIEPKTRKVPRREVKEGEKVNNKVVINPTMSEANEVFKEIGGTVLDIQETESPMSPEEITLLKQRSMINQKIEKAKTKNLNKMKKSEVQERALTDDEKNKKEDIVKGMKKKDGDFEKRYGDDAKSVMYATATKMAKEETAFDRVKKSMGKSFIDTKAPKKEMSPEDKKKEAKRRYDNYLANTKKDDPYRSRPGESD